MDESSKPLAADEIIELFKVGELTAYIFSYENFDDQESTFTLYSELHNAGKIDLLSLTQGPQFESINQNSFFAGQHFFCEVIPKLQASTSELMLCVSRLIKKGGHDLAANQPNAAFREWCLVDLARSQEIIKLARAGDTLAFEFLTFALEAGQFFEEALDILKSYSNGRRLSAITAIGRMKLLNEELVERALDAFLNALEKDQDDALFANIMSSAFEVVARANKPNQRLLEIVRCVCQKPGPQVHFSSARVMWVHTKLLTEELLFLLADGLKSLDPTHKLTIHELDSGLRHLLETPLSAIGIELVRTLLISHPQAISISDFKSFGHKLLEKPEGEFQNLLISWLMSGKKPLCDALSRLVSASGTGDRPIKLAGERLKFSSTEQVFLCRKAIGYFFVHPVFSASILVSILRVCSDDTSKVISQLLFDPLLRNYSGKLREYLSQIEGDDPANNSVKFALGEAASYLADINSIGEISELKPSERERQAGHRRDADEVRKSHKEAMKQSVIMSLVKRSVVLYGKRTITYIQGPNQERRPVEMDLKAHSFGWELPRMTIIDPVGLDFMLRIFRNERFRDETHTP